MYVLRGARSLSTILKPPPPIKLTYFNLRGRLEVSELRPLSFPTEQRAAGRSGLKAPSAKKIRSSSTCSALLVSAMSIKQSSLGPCGDVQAKNLFPSLLFSPRGPSCSLCINRTVYPTNHLPTRFSTNSSPRPPPPSLQPSSPSWPTPQPERQDDAPREVHPLHRGAHALW